MGEALITAALIIVAITIAATGTRIIEAMDRQCAEAHR